MQPLRLFFTLALAGVFTFAPASPQLVGESTAAIAAQDASQSPGTNAAELESRLAAVRGRIEGLPGRACDLRIRWDDYLGLFERTIARVGTDSNAVDEQARTLDGIDDLDRLVSTFEFLSNETCDLHAQYVEASGDSQAVRRSARERFGEVIATVRGNDFPFDRLDAGFRDFYRRRGQWPGRSDSHWSPSNMHVAKSGYDADYAAFAFMEGRTRVRNGVVTVNANGGRQRVNARWSTGGSFLSRNRIYHSVWEDFLDGFQLATGRRTRWCAGYDSKRHCWGDTEELMRRPTRRYRLSGAFFRPLQVALQEEVTAGCERTVADRGALEDVVFDYRPTDRAVRETYEHIADEFVSEVGRLSRRGGDDLCAADNAALMEGIAERASRSAMEIGAGQVASLVYEENRRRLQDLLTRLARNLMLTHTVGPDFASPVAEPAPELDGRRAEPAGYRDGLAG